MSAGARTLARWCGAVMLLCSLLGWSAWWAVCNVYEFAPRLPSWPLAAAWLLALGLLLVSRRPYWLPWLLAAANGLFLLSLHREWGQPVLGPGLWLAVVLLLVWMGRPPAPQTQTAGEMPAV